MSVGGIQKITNSINELLDKVRIPVIPKPAILLICSVFRRPGLSAMMIASKVIKRQSEFGAPTGALPDGTSNKMNSLIYIMTEEIVREIQKSCVVESVVMPGSMVITGFGANAGGPVVITGTNILPTKATGLAR
jgi:hypothetical protein